jgi:hypothetical protein
MISPRGNNTGPYFAGMHPGDFDMRSVILNCIRDPQQLQPTMDYLQAMMQKYNQKKELCAQNALAVSWRLCQ